MVRAGSSCTRSSTSPCAFGHRRPASDRGRSRSSLRVRPRPEVQPVIGIRGSGPGCRSRTDSLGRQAKLRPSVDVTIAAAVLRPGWLSRPLKPILGRCNAVRQRFEPLTPPNRMCGSAQAMGPGLVPLGSSRTRRQQSTAASSPLPCLRYWAVRAHLWTSSANSSGCSKAAIQSLK